jgi:putative ABC transport system permease protein
MNTLMQDVRYALRMLRKSPGFTAIAVLTLALGIGANTAIFSVVDSVLLKPLPYPHSERLVHISQASTKTGEMERQLSYPDFRDIAAQNTVFEHVAVYNDDSTTMTGAGEAQHLHLATVSAEMFSVLDAKPLLGRAFLPGEDKPGAYVTVLSYALWQRQFGGDPAAIGRSITLDGRSFTIVGVMPRGFPYPFDSDAIDLFETFAAYATPLPGGQPMTEERGSRFLSCIARLKPGATLARANQELAAISAGLAQQYPDEDKYSVEHAVPEIDALAGSYRAQFRILLGAVALVLLIGCANVANLLLARATSRQREMAIRAALGATRAQILRQLLIESGLLALGGGAAGLAIAAWGVDFLSKLDALGIPRLAEARLDGRVLLFTLGVALVTGFLFGIAPAWQLSRQSIGERLKEGGRGTSQGAEKHRLRNLLVIVETSLAVVLLAGAGLLLESLRHLERVNPGFDPRGVLTFAISLPDSRYGDGEKALQFYRQLEQRIRALPGVDVASFGLPLPMSDARLRTGYEVEGHPLPPSELPHTHFRVVSDDYFRALRIPLLQGREFRSADRADTTPVVIVNQTLAAHAFPGENPLGKHIWLGVAVGGRPPMREIVGVVADVRHQALDKPSDDEAYAPHEQLGIAWSFGAIRTSLPPESLLPAIREQVRAVDPDIALYSPKTMQKYFDQSVAAPQLNSELLGAFAALALVLAVVGMYGVVSYGVAQRTNEIGIRMTLGAQQRDVLALVLRQGMAMAAVGVAAGVAGAVAATRLLASLLFGVRPGDPAILAAVAALLAACAFLACYIPARRAMRVDPMIALRYE